MAEPRILQEAVDGLRYIFQISVDAGHINPVVTSRLRELRKSTRMPGFRTGRVPLALIRARHGQEIRNSVVDHFAITIANHLINDRGLEPSSRPTIRIEQDDGGPEGNIVFELMLEVMPRVTVGKLDDLTLSKYANPENDPALDDFIQKDLKRQLFDLLLATHAFHVPKDMVENEYRRVVQGFETETGEVVDDDFAAELRGIAERRIRLAILLTEIGRAHQISVPRAEIESLVQKQAERDPLHQSEIIDYYIDHPTAVAELHSPLFEDRVVEFLLRRCTINVIPVSAQELRRIKSMV